MSAPAQRTAEDRGTDRFAGIRQKFRDSIDDRIVLLETARQRMAAGQDASLALQTMAEEAHRISGVADTLGFSRLGAAAARFEAESLALRAARQPAHAIRARMDPLTEDLLDLLEAALEG